MKKIQPGVVVRLKGGNVKFWGPTGLATVVRHEGGCILVMTDAGELGCAREEVSVCRDQSPLREPMRLRLPYGKWACHDGNEFLFNREYQPIWTRPHSGAKAKSVNRDAWIEYVAEEWIYESHLPPWRHEEILTRCERMLVDWGVVA